MLTPSTQEADDSMTFDDLQNRDTNQRAWIFGVCAVLAPKFGWHLGVVRLVTVVMLSWITVPTVIAYVVLAFWLDETRANTQYLTAKWARKADRFVEDLVGSMRQSQSG